MVNHAVCIPVDVLITLLTAAEKQAKQNDGHLYGPPDALEAVRLDRAVKQVRWLIYGDPRETD